MKVKAIRKILDYILLFFLFHPVTIPVRCWILVLLYVLNRVLTHGNGGHIIKLFIQIFQPIIVGWLKRIYHISDKLFFVVFVDYCDFFWWINISFVSCVCFDCLIHKVAICYVVKLYFLLLKVALCLYYPDGERMSIAQTMIRELIVPRTLDTRMENLTPIIIIELLQSGYNLLA